MPVKHAGSGPPVQKHWPVLECCLGGSQRALPRRRRGEFERFALHGGGRHLGRRAECEILERMVQTALHTEPERIPHVLGDAIERLVAAARLLLAHGALREGGDLVKKGPVGRRCLELEEWPREGILPQVGAAAIAPDVQGLVAGRRALGQRLGDSTVRRGDGAECVADVAPVLGIERRDRRLVVCELPRLEATAQPAGTAARSRAGRRRTKRLGRRHGVPSDSCARLRENKVGLWGFWVGPL